MVDIRRSGNPDFRYIALMAPASLESLSPNMLIQRGIRNTHYGPNIGGGHYCFQPDSYPLDDCPVGGEIARCRTSERHYTGLCDQCSASTSQCRSHDYSHKQSLDGSSFCLVLPKQRFPKRRWCPAAGSARKQYKGSVSHELGGEDRHWQDHRRRR